MEKITFVLVGLFFFSSQQKPTTANSDKVCLDIKDAEKVLGMPARQIESSAVNENNVLQYKCTWKATKEELNSNLFYMDEVYADADAAHKIFADIVASNVNPGQSRPDIGDEAWFHSDGTNFCLLIVRKGNKMIRMKVNKITKETSIDEMKRIAGAWSDGSR